MDLERIIVTDRDSAIRAIVQGRDIHQDWVDYIKKYGDRPSVQKELEVAGDLEQHEYCVEKYNAIIKVLQTLPDGSAP